MPVKRKRLVFKGNDRGRLKSLLRSLAMVRGIDDRTRVKMGEEEFEGTLVQNKAVVETAFDRVKDRIEECLALKQ